MRRFLFAAFLIVPCATDPMAGSVKEGISAYNRGDYAEAVRLFRLLAEQGDARHRAIWVGCIPRGKAGHRCVPTICALVRRLWMRLSLAAIWCVIEPRMI